MSFLAVPPSYIAMVLAVGCFDGVAMHMIVLCAAASSIRFYTVLHRWL